MEKILFNGSIYVPSAYEIYSLSMCLKIVTYGIYYIQYCTPYLIDTPNIYCNPRTRVPGRFSYGTQ